MPQMAPLWWEILFLMFLIIYIMVNMIMYFINSPMIKMSNNKSNKYIQFNWKW